MTIDESLGALVAARDRMHEAMRAFDDARKAAHVAILAAGADYQERGARLPVEIMRTLYWDFPEIYTQVIADAAGLRSASDVHLHVGPDNRVMPCLRCGARVRRDLQHRTALATWNGPYYTGRDSRLCAPRRAELFGRPSR